MGRVAAGVVLRTVTESASRPGTFYTQTLGADGHWSCECPDCEYRGRQCRHIRDRKAELAAERGRLRRVLSVLARYDYGTVERRLGELDRYLGPGSE